ncbi:MAG: putative lipoprotein [Fibrobacteres bacterium]|nr:putative lipoprotein [Fibrobacterota bacterium]
MRIHPALFCGFLLLAACGGSGPPLPEDPAAGKDLDAFFLRFRQRVQEGKADSLPAYLSRESLDWIDDMRRASRTEAPAYLAERPFYEILSILALRVERRLNPGFDDRPVAILDKLVIQSWPVKKSLLKSEIGEAKVRGEVGEIGLREAPNVPVFQFIREGGAWKFHLVKSLPLILQGAESLARQRKPTHLEQAIFILEQFGGRTVLAEDLKR